MRYDPRTRIRRLDMQFGSLHRRAQLGACLALYFCAAAPAWAQPARNSELCPDPGSTMLWEVQGEDLRARGITLHLFGTIHVGKLNFYPLAAPVEERFRAAEHMVFEVDPNILSSPDTMRTLQARALLPDNQTLDQVLNPATLQDLSAVLEGQGVPLQTVMRLKPWMIAMLLSDLQVRALGFNALWGLESYLLNQMTPGGNVLELESLQQQLDLLERLSSEAFLDYSLRDFEASAAQIETLVQAWACGDHATLEALLFEEPKEDLSETELAELTRINEQMFVVRNRIMADGVVKLIESGQDDYFVAVGAGHLLGPDSVVELLRQEGYTVQEVRR
jgi:uncharacterized protein YbaP (TraB family)